MNDAPHINRRWRRILAWMVVGLVVAELLLVFLSWLLSATMTEGVHSLLSGEGIRWMAGHVTQTLQSPLLIWLLLIAMSVGCLVKSGLPHALRQRHSYRHRLALRLTLVLLLVCIGVMLLLTVVPHAVLISATGSLWPSPFSEALIPAFTFILVLLSVCYGVVSHTFTSVVTITDSLVWGLAKAAPLILLYILGIHFFVSLRFVFI